MFVRERTVRTVYSAWLASKQAVSQTHQMPGKTNTEETTRKTKQIIHARTKEIKIRARRNKSQQYNQPRLTQN